MTDHDDQLTTRVTASLRRRAAALPPDPDGGLADLHDRLATRAGRRSRALGVALVLALVAGPLVGFAAGRATGDEDVSVDAAGDGFLASPSPTIPPGGGAGGPTEEGAYEPGTAPGRLFQRSTADGLVVSAFTWAYEEEQTLAVCQPSGALHASVMSPKGGGIGSLDLEVVRERPEIIAVGNIGGYNEGDEFWSVAVATPVDGTVEAVFPSGARDHMQTVDRLAVLAARWPDETRGGAEGAIDVVLRDASGTEVAATSVAALTSDGGIECDPRALPEPGEQPADVEAAEAAVRTVLETALSTGEGLDRYFVDPEALVDEQAQIEAGDWDEQYPDVAAVVDEVVFTAPEKAAVAFRIRTPGGDFPYTGEVVLVEGQWKVTNATWCTIIGPTGITCN